MTPRARRAHLLTAGFHALNALGELTHAMPPTMQTIVRRAWVRAHAALDAEANKFRAEVATTATTAPTPPARSHLRAVK